MPFTESSKSSELKSMLQGIGMAVFGGLDSIMVDESERSNDDQSCLVIVHADDWKFVAIRQKLPTMGFPNSTTLCVVTGLVPLPDSVSFRQSPIIDDARLLLAAAGVGFFSIEGVPNDLVV